MPRIKSQLDQACPPKPALSERQLIHGPAARDLVQIFKILANETRLKLLHALVRENELPVNALAGYLGMKPQAISNQLQKLASHRIVEPERRGNLIYYRILDPCVVDLLDRGLCLNEDQKAGR